MEKFKVLKSVQKVKDGCYLLISEKLEVLVEFTQEGVTYSCDPSADKDAQLMIKEFLEPENKQE